MKVFSSARSAGKHGGHAGYSIRIMPANGIPRDSSAAQSRVWNATCWHWQRGWEGWGSPAPSQAERDYLNSCTPKLLFNFHCDTVMVLRGLRGNGCEELDPREQEAFQTVCLGWVIGNSYRNWVGVWTKWPLVLSSSQPGADNHVLCSLWYQHVSCAVFSKRTLKIF